MSSVDWIPTLLHFTNFYDKYDDIFNNENNIDGIDLYNEIFNKITTLCSFKSLLLFLYLFPSGIIYFILMDAADGLLDLFKVFAYVFMCKREEQLSVTESNAAKLFGISRMHWESFHRQHILAQLFFETVPQVILQVTAFIGIIDGLDVAGITSKDLFVSVSAAILNSLFQLWRIYGESRAISDDFISYSLECATAKFAWIPFSYKIRKFFNNDLQDKHRNKKFCPHTACCIRCCLLKPYHDHDNFIDFGNIFYRYPLITRMSRNINKGKVLFKFSHTTMRTLITLIKSQEPRGEFKVSENTFRCICHGQSVLGEVTEEDKKQALYHDNPHIIECSACHDKITNKYYKCMNGCGYGLCLNKLHFQFGASLELVGVRDIIYLMQICKEKGNIALCDIINPDIWKRAFQNIATRMDTRLYSHAYDYKKQPLLISLYKTGYDDSKYNILKLFIREYDVPINMHDDKGNSIIHEMIKSDDYVGIETVLSVAKADQTINLLSFDFNNLGESIMYLALIADKKRLQEQNMQLIHRLLLEHNVEINMKITDRKQISQTILGYVLTEYTQFIEYCDIVEYLIDKNAKLLTDEIPAFYKCWARHAEKYCAIYEKVSDHCGIPKYDFEQKYDDINANESVEEEKQHSIEHQKSVFVIEEDTETQNEIYKNIFSFKDMKQNTQFNASKDNKWIEIVYSCIVETFSAMDLYTDIVILLQLYQSDNIWWTTFTLILLLSPYLVSFGPLATLIQRQERPSSFALLLITPFALILAIVIDIIFIFCSLITTFIILPVIYVINKIKKCRNKDSYINFRKFLIDMYIFEHIFKMNRTEIIGYRRLRSLSQLTFESIPQIFLQCWIMWRIEWQPHHSDTDPSNFNTFKINATDLRLSIILAIIHVLLESIVIFLDSSALQMKFLQYGLVALGGRVDFIPYGHQIKSKIENQVFIYYNTKSTNIDNDENTLKCAELCEINCCFNQQDRFENNDVFDAVTCYIDTNESKTTRDLLLDYESINVLIFQFKYPLVFEFSNRSMKKMSDQLINSAPMQIPSEFNLSSLNLLMQNLLQHILCKVKIEIGPESCGTIDIYSLCELYKSSMNKAKVNISAISKDTIKKIFTNTQNRYKSRKEGQTQNIINVIKQNLIYYGEIGSVKWISALDENQDEDREQIKFLLDEHDEEEISLVDESENKYDLFPEIVFVQKIKKQILKKCLVLNKDFARIDILQNCFKNQFYIGHDQCIQNQILSIVNKFYDHCIQDTSWCFTVLFIVLYSNGIIFDKIVSKTLDSELKEIIKHCLPKLVKIVWNEEEWKIPFELFQYQFIHTPNKSEELLLNHCKKWMITGAIDRIATVKLSEFDAFVFNLRLQAKYNAYLRSKSNDMKEHLHSQQIKIEKNEKTRISIKIPSDYLLPSEHLHTTLISGCEMILNNVAFIDINDEKNMIEEKIDCKIFLEDTHHDKHLDLPCLYNKSLSIKEVTGLVNETHDWRIQINEGLVCSEYNYILSHHSDNLDSIHTSIVIQSHGTKKKK
eukprot:460797_1